MDRNLIPKNEFKHLQNWFHSKDYSYQKNISIEDYLVEIEERLALYNFAILANSSSATDKRWLNIDKGEVRLSSSYYKPSIGSDCDAIITLKDSELELLQQIKVIFNKSIKDKIPHSFDDKGNIYEVIKTNELNAVTREYVFPFSDELNEMRREYVFPFSNESTRIALLANIQEYDNATLLEQLRVQIETARELLQCPEPKPKKGNKKQTKSLKSFVMKKAIQYLDIYLYCLIKSPANSKWYITNSQLDEILFNREIGTEILKADNSRFYKNLLNHHYMATILSEIRGHQDYDKNGLLDSIFIN